MPKQVGTFVWWKLCCPNDHCAQAQRTSGRLLGTPTLTSIFRYSVAGLVPVLSVATSVLVVINPAHWLVVAGKASSQLSPRNTQSSGLGWWVNDPGLPGES